MPGKPRQSAFGGLHSPAKAAIGAPHPGRVAAKQAKIIRRRRTSGRSSGVEHNLAKVGVEGSNPFARSNFLPVLVLRRWVAPMPSEPSESFVALRGFAAPLGGSNPFAADPLLLHWFICRGIRWASNLKAGRMQWNDPDLIYARANLVAWGGVVGVAGVCLWPDVPNGILLLAALGILGAALFCLAIPFAGISARVLKADANAGLLILVLFMPLMLGIRAMTRFDLVDWRWPLVAAVVAGFPLTYALLGLLNSKPGRIAPILLSAFLSYCGPGMLVWSGLQFANSLGTPTLVAERHLTVLNKRVLKNKSSKSYVLDVEPQSDLGDLAQLKTDPDTYAGLPLGGEACIRVWRGTLAMRWFVTHACPPIPPKVAIRPA